MSTQYIYLVEAHYSDYAGDEYRTIVGVYMYLESAQKKQNKLKMEQEADASSSLWENHWSVIHTIEIKDFGLYRKNMALEEKALKGLDELVAEAQKFNMGYEN